MLHNTSVYSVRQSVQSTMNLFLLVCICFNTLGIDAKDGEAVCQTAGCTEAAQNIKSSYDPSVNPCDDFYRYSCGNWIAKHEIPGDSGTYGKFKAANDAAASATKKLLETDTPTTISQPIVKLLRSFYQKCMAAETLTTVEPTLTAIVFNMSVVNKQFEFGSFYGDLMSQYAISPFYHAWSSADEKETNKNVLYIETPDLILKAPEYYLDATYKNRLDAYKTYIKDVLEAIKSGSSVGRVDGIINVEKKIAKALADAKKDESENYNKMSITELKKTVTKVDWKTFLNKILPHDIRKKFNDNTKLVVTSLVYFKAFDQIAKMDAKDLINFGYWSAIQQYVALLAPKFADLNFKLDQILTGADKQQKRSDLCVSQIKEKLNVAVGALYVDTYFSNAAKKEAETMLDNMRDQLPDTFAKLDWMDEKTQSAAKKKGKNSIFHVGYPKYVKVASELEKFYKGLDANAVARESSFLKLQLLVARWKQLKDLNELNDIPDRAKADFDASIANAAYIAQTNSIVVNAGLLQPPLFKETYPKYINYGSMGYCIGHEIIHGYDSNGAMFDEIGTRRDWWSDSSAKKFKDKVKCFIDKFNTYTVKQVSMKVNGDLTKGENVADSGGLKLASKAYQAYQAYIGKNGKNEPQLPGLNLTNKQAFFVSAAMFWCDKSKNAALINQLNTDIHPPGEQRVLGMMSNSKEFADAFNCKANANYNPTKKCVVY